MAHTAASARLLVLGSSSRYRADLLGRLGVTFTQVSPDIDETALAEELPADLVLRLAASKADAVAAIHPDAIIVASDQVASVDERVLGKPGTESNAIAQLQALSGKRVTFYTSLHVRDAASGVRVSELDLTEVQFRPLSEGQIERYVAAELPLDCAGAFKSEGLGIAMFEHVKSDDPTALIGLPLIKLCSALATLGQPVLGLD